MCRNTPLRLLRRALLTAAIPTVALAQEDPRPSPIRVALGAVRTAAERSAVGIAIDITQDLNGVEFQLNQGRSLVYFTPDVQIQTGEEDAFDAIVAKVTGSLVLFGLTEVGGIETPDTRFFHAFPFSAGFETDRRFDAVNAVLEAGWVPWFQGAAPGVLKSAYVGVFVQGGYKARVGDSTETAPPEAGNLDESEEGLDHGLFRLKASLKWAPRIRLGGDEGFAVGLVTAAHAWYDIANGATYHRVEAKGSIGLGKDRSFEFGYENGSGAPNFNEGDQLGAALVVTF